MNDTVKLLLERKSVRVYEDRPIPEEDVRLILEAAVQAPTAGNMSLWSCIRVQDQTLKEELAEMCGPQPFIAKAPLVLMFYADYHRWMKAFTGFAPRQPQISDRQVANVDAIIAAQSAIVAAEAMGYGTCYIGSVVEHWEWHKERFAIPEHVQPVCMAVIGIPTELQLQRLKPRRFRMEDLVFTDRYRDDDVEHVRSMLAERQGIASEEELNTWLTAFCARKWNSEYNEERIRSTAAMMKDWPGKQ